MNKARRTRIQKLADQLENLKIEFEDILDEEEGAYDNMPESFQESEKGQAMQDGIYSLEEILENLETAYDEMTDFIEE